jgi:glycosyltransferase involved in cell wall biosynthesis
MLPDNPPSDRRMTAVTLKPTRTLLVIQNDNFPQDARVLNEARALARLGPCVVLAPRAAGQSIFECLGDMKVFRFPGWSGASLGSLLIEYLVSLFWLGWTIPVIALTHRIHVIHVANPPDFIIPAVAWLRLFGVKLVYDVHDISVETFKAKLPRNGHWLRLLSVPLRALEWSSIRLADLVVATNETILERVRGMHGRQDVVVVRNSNEKRFDEPGQIRKPRSVVMNVGYFGVVARDAAAGLDNFIALAQRLRRNEVDFKMTIVGSGAGLAHVSERVQAEGLVDRFEFHGFVALPEAFELIEQFDFGLVTWGDLPKNHMHTAMKVMDYMCCAVPVCSLNLTEQLRSTSGIGIHADSFEDIADAMTEVFRDRICYESLRQQTLDRFNRTLSWQMQEAALMSAYARLHRPLRTLETA